MEEFRLQQAEEDARLLDKAKATMAMPTSDHETPQVSTYEDATESQAQISGSEGVTRPDSLFFQNADDETDSGPEEDEMAALIREAEELQGAITVGLDNRSRVLDYIYLSDYEYTNCKTSLWRMKPPMAERRCLGR